MLISLLVFGLWPALRATKLDLARSAKAPLASPRRLQARSVMVAIQTALAVMLLIPATLFAKSFARAGAANPGFRVENVLTMTLSPALGGYSEQQTQAFYTEIQKRVGKMPGVVSAALATHLVMGSDSDWQVIAPVLPGADKGDTIGVMFNQVTPEYFATMAVPIVRGRRFDEHDTMNSPPVAIVSQALAGRFWPHESPLGRRVRFGEGAKAQVLEVVGIAGDAKYQEVLDQMEPYLYLASRQQSPQQVSLLVHTAGDPSAMIPVIRRELKIFAADVPVFEVHTMRELFEGHGLFSARLMAQMVGAMGGIGLTLGIVGLYAVVAFSVSRRIREIGIRMALGATSSLVLRGVLASGARVALAGIAAGLLGAFLLARYLAEFLDLVNPRDPAAFVGVAAVMLAVTLAACWSPARRASKVDPAITLRYE